MEHMEQQQYKFDTKVSQIIKGIAILIMVFHHLFGNTEWILEESKIVSIPMGQYSLEYYISVFGKICIAIYAFVSGYGLYASYERKRQSLTMILKRAFLVLLNWWLIVLLFFLPLALICKQQIDAKVLLGNLLLVNNTWCPFSDYLLFYLTAILTYSGVYWVLKKVNKPWLFFFGLPFVSMFLRKIVDMTISQEILYQLVYFYLLYLPFMVAGSCIYQSGAFLKIHEWLKGRIWNKITVKVLLLVGMIPIRWLSGNKLSLDSFLATVMVFLFVELIQGREEKVLVRVLSFLGKHSTNLWFLHAAFFFTFAKHTQWIVYFPRVPVLIMVWCIVCCLPFSWCINLLQDRIWLLLKNSRKEQE